jgi:transposase
MWEPFRQSIEQWAKDCRIVYDKFHIMQHAASAIDEVRRAEFSRRIVRRRRAPASITVLAGNFWRKPRWQAGELTK